jgi:hypothetical protein
VRLAAVSIAWVMAFDLPGRKAHDLRMSGGSCGFVPAVAAREGTLVVSSLHRTDVLMGAVRRS